MSKNTNLSFLTDYITADITNGRIGINNASPAYAFDVTGIARTSTSTYLATASGNVGIGTITPGLNLSVQGLYGLPATSGVQGTGILRVQDSASNIALDMGVIQNAGTWIQSGNKANSAVLPLALNPSGGNILMGTTSNNGERLYVSGAIRATGTITANSDLTLKKNLLKIENALEKVEQINGYTYELKADDSKRHAGVIAQEIQTVLPEIVNTGNDGLMGVEYGNISALLIEAIKELSAEITILKNK